MSSIGITERPAGLSGVSLRGIVIPKEHGGWGIVLEPALAALIAAQSGEGLAIAMAALATFLARQPARMVTGDLVMRHRVYPRTIKALVVTTSLIGVAAALLGIVAIARGIVPLVPLAAATPLVAIQLVYDARNRSRNLLPEIAGGVAMGASAAMILLAAGSRPSSAAALWLLMALRSTGAIVYVRSRLRRSRGHNAGAAPSIALHGVAIAVSSVLVTFEIAPPIAGVVFVLLLVRAARGLAPNAPHASAKRVGFAEIGWGIATALALGIGFRSVP